MFTTYNCSCGKETMTMHRPDESLDGFACPGCGKVKGKDSGNDLAKEELTNMLFDECQASRIICNKLADRILKRVGHCNPIIYPLLEESVIDVLTKRLPASHQIKHQEEKFLITESKVVFGHDGKLKSIQANLSPA